MKNIQALIESAKYPELGTSDKASMMMLLENTQKEQDKLVNEGTLSGDVAQFTPILMPLVRRVYPNLIANELLGVQPMSMPTGFIYALTNEYTGNGVLGQNINPNAAAKVVSVVASAATVAPVVGDTLTFVTAGTTGTVAFVAPGIVPVGSPVGTVAYKLLVGTVAAPLPGETITGLTGQVLADTVTVGAVYSNEASFGNILPGYTGTYATAAAEILATDMREVGFSIARKNVTAVSRALKGQYTVEMYQDLKAQHGLLADEEIMSLMSYEMQAEIDREVVNFVNTNSTQLPDTAFGTVNAASATTDGRWEIERYRAQAIRISAEAAMIGVATKRGQGNTLIVSPKVATMLEQVGTFKTATQKSEVAAPVSGGVAGVFDGRYKVIVDQYAVSDYCTVMYKGADRRDAMGFFAPYVPMSFTKVTHQDSGQPAVIAKCRYALDTIPGISSPISNDRAATYSRSFGVNFANTVLGGI